MTRTPISSRRRSKRLGVTTMEFMVSSGIMMAATILSFGAMIQSVKVSKSAVNSGQKADVSRRGIDRLSDDIRKASAVMGKVKLDVAYVADKHSTLILRIPAVDLSGNNIPNASEIVVYDVDSSGSGKKLVRKLARQTNGVCGPITETSVEAENLKGLSLLPTRCESLPNTANKFTLPGTITLGNPSGTQIKLVRVSAPFANLNIDLTGLDPKIDVMGIMKAGVTATLTSVTIPAAAATDRLDVSYEFDMTKFDPVTWDTKANEVRVAFVTETDCSGGLEDKEQTFVAKAAMRNAK